MRKSTSIIAATAIAAVALFAPGIAATTAGAADAVNPGLAHAADNITIDDPLAPGRLYLRAVPGGVIDTAQLPDARAARQFDPDRRYVVQLDGPITPDRRSALEDAGIQLAEYIPAYAYLADLRHAAPQALAAIDFILWVGPWADEWKLDPELGNRPGITPERQQMIAQGRLPVFITLFRAAEREGAAAALANLDPAADVHFMDELAGNPIISATIDIDQIAALASIAQVQFVEEAPDIITRNNNVRWVVQSNINGVTPLYAQGLRGEGQIAGVLDTRLDANHCSFSDPGVPIGPDHRKIVAYNTSHGAQSHGTHVTGTAVGDAGANANTRGVAYLGRVAYNTWPNFNEQAIYQRFTLHHSQGARHHTNSWGDDGTTSYNGLARGIDSFQWDYEESQTYWAVTNTNTLKNPENAKNTLAVGATSPPPNQHNHCTGGTGPTSDGRRKPEIYAPGCSTVSSTPGTCNTGSSSGTSMASPAVAGTGMLVAQYYMDGFYPLGHAEPGYSFVPSGALVKATLLNSAVDMTGVPGYPSNQEGWGRALADDSLYFMGDDRSLVVFDVWNADGLSTGHVNLHEVNVVGSSEKLKVTLVWTDPPGAAGTSFAAVNDLDLVVTGPNGVFKGNVFQGGVSVPGGNKDDRNNVEQVHVPNPGPGLWTIEVIGFAVNQHKQGYALAVTGEVATEEPPLTVMLPNGAPGLIDPGVAVEFDVRIIAGQEGIEPGSELLYWRMNGGSFASAALTHVSGDLYVASLPAALCADVPEFYVSATGDGGTVRTSPPNAPDSYYTATVGEIQETEILYQSFVDGPPPGWSLSGMWHVTASCAKPDPCIGGQWAYYGRSDTCNYVTPGGGANSGLMVSSQIALPSVPPGGTISLEFCYNLHTEPSQSYDIARFSINGQNWTQFTDSPTWTTHAVDATSHAGQNVTLHWHFDTIDHLYNDYHGWQIDEVRIVASGLVCEDPQCGLGDLNCDGSVGVADLLILLSLWGPCDACTPGDCPADLTGDCNVGVADLLVLLGNWG